MSNPEENEELDTTYWQKTYEKQRSLQLKRKYHLSASLTSSSLAR
jgi:hypothetical protein